MSLLPIRIALGLGDQELEQRIRPALDADDDLVVALNCLAADQVVQALASDNVDVFVLAWGLHRLTDSILQQLEHAHRAVILLSPAAAETVEHLQRTTVLPLEIEPETLRAAIKTSARGERWRAQPRKRIEAEPQSATAPSTQVGATENTLQVIAVAGGSGSPGRTTVALNLATALGAIVPTALVDLDCASPCVAAFLNLDPSRNVCTLAHTVREEPSAWGRAIQQELQPLHPRSPQGFALCGLPKRELRPSVTPAILEKLIQELRRRFRYVIIDVGAELLGMDAPALVHRSALSLAQHVLLVTSCELVSLWHARIALSQFEHTVAIERDRITLVANRHDPHYHHVPAEIEWHLGAPITQVIPNDYRAAQRAMVEQSPIVLESGSRAGRAIVQLAERVHHGHIRIPAARVDKDPPKSRWRAAMPAAIAGLVHWGGPT